MLLDFNDLVRKYKINIRGVIQIGAHRAQEDGLYRKHGVKNIIYIEPSSKNFKILYHKFNGDENVILVNCACGDKKGEGVAYLDTNNQGMSSSLLAPKDHLIQHKEVIFDDAEVWKVERLDDIPFDRDSYNLLNMDVQGFEDRVIKGGLETLNHIDYVFTEINRSEMYEECARIELIDELLSEFTRVETGWASPTHGWGDALFIKSSLL